jgi:hypothetical protein
VDPAARSGSQANNPTDRGSAFLATVEDVDARTEVKTALPAEVQAAWFQAHRRSWIRTETEKISVTTLLRACSQLRFSTQAKKLLPLTLLLSAASFVTARAEAQDLDSGKTNLRLRWVKSSETRLGPAVIGVYDPSPESNYAISADWGRRFSDTLFSLPIEMTANLGLQYFAERGYQPDAWGATAYIKAHYTWRLPYTELHIRFGLGEGLSYVTRIPMSEQRDFAKKGVESANLMNYMEWTIDVPLRQFEVFAPMFNGHIKEAYIGYTVWHRSSVFGLFADTKGGVNFMGFGFELRY